ncbi:MAG: hypothetical protein Hyperionvirus9_15 [Hyperionvirus sp.]|uniref:Uncharacterized protein n=1 Tax=Hyperionvirus sp. TaxID=2487770 RepID=A0A3G5A8M7_9VIRU|nr:MAG: hypothetical protein Hyperionvirus9_15 [Hyperionvirus sp.]
MSQNYIYIDTSPDYYYTEGHAIPSYNKDELTLINNKDLDKKTKRKKQRAKSNITLEGMINLIANKNIDRIKELLENDKHCKAIINLTDKDNETLLHFSIFSDSYDMSRLLLKYGADPNRKDNEGQAPIFRIVFASDEKIIGLLLEYGAILDLQDKEGNTALHIAVLTKNYKMITALLDYGVNPLVRNNDSLLSLDFAISRVGGKIILDEKIISIFGKYIG